MSIPVITQPFVSVDHPLHLFHIVKSSSKEQKTLQMATVIGPVSYAQVGLRTSSGRTKIKRPETDIRQIFSFIINTEPNRSNI